MIPKPLESISELDIESLVEHQVPEGRRLEYKLLPPDASYDQRKEFLADVSSFANSEGGDLVLGVEESAGVPTRVAPLILQDVDAEVQRLENLIRDGLSPRISVRIRSIASKGGHVVIIRTTRSLNRPHRVVFRGHDKFYSRNSGGKYELDVDELRGMFASSGDTAREIERFVRSRTDEILLGNSFVPLSVGGKLVLLLLPLDSFRPAVGLDVLNLAATDLPPIYWLTSGEQINLEGRLVYCDSGLGYIEIYRNGVIESVAASLFKDVTGKDTKEILGSFVEGKTLEAVSKYFEVYQKLEIGPPIGISLCLLDVMGHVFSQYSGNVPVKRSQPCTRRVLTLPMQMVEDLSEPPEKIMRPLFDLLWNAFGFRKSASYDDAGHWHPT